MPADVVELVDSPATPTSAPRLILIVVDAQRRCGSLEGIPGPVRWASSGSLGGREPRLGASKARRFMLRVLVDRRLKTSGMTTLVAHPSADRGPATTSPAADSASVEGRGGTKPAPM